MRRFLLSSTALLLAAPAAAQNNYLDSSGQFLPVPYISANNFGLNSAASDNTVAFQAAINAVSAGGTVDVFGSNYNVLGPIVITKPVKIRCSNFNNASGGNINLISTTGDIFQFNANGVAIEDCYLNGTGTPTTSRAIAVGTDAITITDAACNTGTSTTLTSTSQAQWSAASVGQRVNVAGAGVGGINLFATITAVGGALSATISPGCSTTVTGATALYGNVYLEVSISNVKTINFNKGVHFVDAAQFRVSKLWSEANIALHVQNTLSPDFGDSFISDSTFQTISNAAGQYGLWYQSSGGLKISNSKFLNGQYGIYLNWNLGLSGVLNLTGSSIENCGTYGIFMSNNFTFNGFAITGNEIACGSPNINISNTATQINGGVISGNFFQGGGGSAVSAGKINYLTMVGNLINNGAVSPGIAITSNCADCYFAENNMPGASQTYTNASTTTTIMDRNGMTSSNLPSAAAAGSQIFVSDGTTASSPCTGSGNGSTAFRQNGAWKCF